MTGDVEEIQAWCAASTLPCREGEDGVLLVRLQPEDRHEVRVEPPRGQDPLRLTDEVSLATHDLDLGRLAEVIEGVVLSRSSLVDARPTADGHGAEVVVVVHPEGLNRHTFVEAAFEIEKIRLLLQREVSGAAAAEHTLAALEALAGEVWTTAAPSA